MKKRFKFTTWLSRVVIRLTGSIQLFPSQPFFFVFWGSTHYKIKGPEMRVILNALKPGDILLRRYDRYVSGWFIPGYYTHAAIYLGGNQVGHSVTHGIFKEDILTFLRADEVAVLRLKDLKHEELDKAVEFIDSVIGHGYDFDFGHHRTRFYCTSLVRQAYRGRFSGMSGVIAPDDFFEQELNVVHDSRQHREQYG